MARFLELLYFNLGQSLLHLNIAALGAQGGKEILSGFRKKGLKLVREIREDENYNTYFPCRREW